MKRGSVPTGQVQRVANHDRKNCTIRAQQAGKSQPFCFCHLPFAHWIGGGASQDESQTSTSQPSVRSHSQPLSRRRGTCSHPGRAPEGVRPRQAGSQLREAQFPSNRNGASHLALASVLVTDWRYYYRICWEPWIRRRGQPKECSSSRQEPPLVGQTKFFFGLPLLSSQHAKFSMWLSLPGNGFSPFAFRRLVARQHHRTQGLTRSPIPSGIARQQFLGGLLSACRT